MLLGVAPTRPTTGELPAMRLARLNQAFLEHLNDAAADAALRVEAIREAWVREYRDAAPESFVPDALGELYPAFGEALRAFDEGRVMLAADAFARLVDSDDPFVAANAAYFYVRSLAAANRYDEIVAAFAQHDWSPAKIEPYCPQAAALAYVHAVARVRTLEVEQGRADLEKLAARESLPEALRNGVRQMMIELEQREPDSLDQVATLMEYVQTRLTVPDTTQRVQQREEQIVALLDKLIEKAEQQEKQCGGGGSAKAAGEPLPGGPGGQGQQGQQAAEESYESSGQGRIGDLHGAPRVDPGEMWGKLPPEQRERILQTLRERYPSRYRQLVEQYFRSLAEEK